MTKSVAVWQIKTGSGKQHDVLGMTMREFTLGVGDVLILPLVLIAFSTKKLVEAALSILIHILDYAFPILLQLMRFPLFTVRLAGDSILALLRGIIGLLPLSNAKREALREFVTQHWSWLRQKISYQAFERAVHHVFESGMAWVFRTCSRLPPPTALLVIAGAVLWFPISLLVATAVHAALIAHAASLPTWMQLLHPLATFIAKSKLLVLPVYPAAWPEAKRHALVQAIFRFSRYLVRLRFIQKTRYRYRQTECAIAKIANTLGRIAALIGFKTFFSTLLARINRLAVWVGNRPRVMMLRAVERFPRAPLIGSIVASYAARFGSESQQRPEKLSKQVRGFFERWSIKFSAQYYEDDRGRAYSLDQADKRPAQAHKNRDSEEEQIRQHR